MPDTVQVSERSIAVPGGDVYVRTWMPRLPAAEIPVVLLHDSLGCVEMWRSFPAALAERLNRPVIAYDRLGFGRSSARTALPSLRFINEEAEIFLPAILEALGQNKAIAFGHSVGGCMAVAWAGRHPAVCPGVITESAQAFVEEQTREGIRRSVADFDDPATLAKLARYHGAKAPWLLRAWRDIWLSPEFADWSLESDLRKVRCPLLAIHGDRDEFGSSRFPEAICEFAGARSEKLIIPDCGHVPHREQQDVVLQAMARFLGQA
jgi:pimeloyl-ACP methyl ester carboxylesterase